MEKKKTIIDDEILKSIKEKIENIRFGSVTIVVHDRKIVQLETSEKTRFSS